MQLVLGGLRLASTLAERYPVPVDGTVRHKFTL